MGRRLELAAIALLALALPIPASAISSVPIDTVPPEYAPINGPQTAEPVSLSSFHFEANRETQRARVVVEYTYPDAMIYARGDPTAGLQSTVAQISGLSYNLVDHEAVYESNGAKTVCAMVEDRGGLFGHYEKISNTAACSVTARLEDFAEDDGWGIHRFRARDTYFNVQSTATRPAVPTR
jgi:hypothetical protein